LPISTLSKTQRFSNYEAPKYTTRKLKSVERLRNIFRVFKQHYMDFCDPNSSMLGAELAYDPKIKFVTLLKYYNFVLGYTSMQRF